MDTNPFLSLAEREALQFMREEEKLARDVYLTFHHWWRLPVFGNIAASEQRHTESVQRLLQAYGIPDPVQNDRVGVFAHPELARLYADLVARGHQSAYEALQVGALIEETDIADLQDAIRKTSQPAIARVYNHLMQASHRHLRAFAGQLQNHDGAYAAQLMPQAEVDAIMAYRSSPADGDVARLGGGRRMGQGGSQPLPNSGISGGGKWQGAGMAVWQPTRQMGGAGCGGRRRGWQGY